MKTHRMIPVAVATLSFGVGMIWADEPASGAAPAEPPTGALTVGGFGGEGLGLGLADGLIKTWASENSVVLLNPRVSVGSGEYNDWSAGLIFRRLTGAREGRFTLYGRYESQNSPYDNQFGLWASGTEYRDKWLTLNVRGRYSDDDAELIEREVEEELLSNGGRIVRTFERYEAPMSGVDGEAGVRIPIPPWLGVARVLGGFYAFDADEVGSENGWSARVEYKPHPLLSIDGIAYFDRDFEDAQYFAGARVTVPFGPGGIASQPPMDSFGGDLWTEPVDFVPRTAVSASGREENVGARQEIAPPPRRKKEEPVYEHYHPEYPYEPWPPDEWNEWPTPTPPVF